MRRTAEHQISPFVHALDVAAEAAARPERLTPMRLAYWPLDKFVPYTRHARKNNHAVERMCAMIREFGIRLPLLVRSSGELVDGHLRLKAARKLGLPELPVIVDDDWTEAQVKAFRLLLNRSPMWAEWDRELLALEFADLRQLDYDLGFTGFEAREIEQLLFANDPAGEEPVPLSPQPVSRRGDLWHCGAHRILCGDATAPGDVARLLGAVVPVLMNADPPYGVHYEPGWRERAGLGRQRQTGVVANDDRCDWTAAYELFPGDVAYVWHAGLYAGEVAANLAQAGFEIRAQIVWAKQHFALSRGDYHWQHEPAWYAVRRGRSSRWRGDRRQSTLWEIANLNAFGGARTEDAVTGHGTQKPLETARRPVLNHTEAGEAIYDPFLGSGTTLIAAEQTGRVCHGLELEPRYIDAAVARWEAFTGRAAVLDGDGRTFQQIRAERDGPPKDPVDGSQEGA